MGAGGGEEIDTLFKGAEANDFQGIDGDECQTLEKSRGRVEMRTYHSLDAEDLPSAKDFDLWEESCEPELKKAKQPRNLNIISLVVK